jgi:hypothetical protein
MKLRRVASFSRYRAPKLIVVHGRELRERRKVSPFARALFDELVALATPDGHIATTYAVLIALMDFDGARGDDVPTIKRIRVALDGLVAIGLLGVNPTRNLVSRCLIFELKDAGRVAASANRRGSSQGRPLKAADPALARAGELVPLPSGQASGQGLLDPEIHTGDTDSAVDNSERRAELRTEMRALADRLRKRLK